MSVVDFSVLAKADLKEIWDYVSVSGDDVADRVMDEVLQKCELIAQNLRIGKNQDKVLVNLRSFPHKKYVIFYFIIENGIEIYRIVHSSRDIETLFTEYFEGLDE